MAFDQLVHRFRNPDALLDDFDDEHDTICSSVGENSGPSTRRAHLDGERRIGQSTTHRRGVAKGSPLFTETVYGV
jgi:hypothetical protein